MKFILKTLIDITETNARFQKQELSWKQQQNYLVVLNTIGLRCNPMPIYSPMVEEVTGTSVGFGTRYRTAHRVWTWQFEIPYGNTSIDLLQQDFHMVPVITGLTETAPIQIQAFDCFDEKNLNIIFQETL